jgi:hypothetical protein
METLSRNMLQLKSIERENLVLMSKSAFLLLSIIQISALERYSCSLYFAIPNIEKMIGGSIRCMLSEIFLTTN